MLVLLTRALDQALRSAEKLAANGHRAILSPVLDMVPTGAQWPQGVFDGILATSTQAFELFSDSPEWPSPEQRRLLPLFVVGERTQDAARERGFSGPAQIAVDAKELAELVGKRFAEPARLVYLAGRDRKPTLEDELARSGHEIEAVEVYAAQPAEALTEEAVAGLLSGDIRAVLHYSRRSAEIFLDLVREAGLDVSALIHVAMSPDAAEPLWAAGFKKAHACEKPKEKAMLKLVNELAILSKASLGAGMTRS